MTAVPPTPTPPPGPEHAEQLTRAKARFKPIRKALAVAGFNAWTVIVFAALTLLVALASTLLGDASIAGLLVGAGLLAGGIHELMARSRLARLDPRALARLAWNQALFAGVITLYCLWSIANIDTSVIAKALANVQSQTAGQLDDSTRATLTQIGNATAMLVRGFYALIILLTILIEALLAWYYLAKRKHLAAYLRETPPWAQDMQRRNLLR